MEKQNFPHITTAAKIIYCVKNSDRLLNVKVAVTD
ncbi:hypothetical protein LFAB_10840 [Lactiplantibacillus fabifermentans T30PCM01]|uniref:Uncharacterized protein n=1 Tax=Lactiplantibacillus fabifermentans T30PCM01 TaxID=1400520 RepID=W6T7D0_9LACO|nr:hypothetical protein LFAB_10840 [Lactiplantibacillus fabifermentans T30PCM01]